MTGLVEAVRASVEDTCVVQGRMGKQGCSVSLRDAPKLRLVVDFDRPGSPMQEDETRCDYLLVAEVPDNPGWVVPLELKRGRLDAGKAVVQLRAGARVAESLVPNTMRVSFRPVVASGGSKAERGRLRAKNSRVKFRGAAEYVRLIRCGDRLAKALGA